MIRALIVGGFLFLAACASFAQSGKAPAFEVASVKPAEPSGYMDFRIQPGGRLEVTSQTLRLIVMQAFGVKGYQLSGGPSWMDTDRFDIVGKAEGNPSHAEVMAMLQTLLADRFQLKVHQETKEGNIYALVVGKNGPKLKPPVGEANARSMIYLQRITPRDQPGINYALDGHKATMVMLAGRLTDEVRRPVLDHTGLTGEFDFNVAYSIDDNPETGPSIFNALQEQLGLRLETTKGPIETLVIEHAEKPSGN
jgi:uncharacterized protein (TIGR03435 family)